MDNPSRRFAHLNSTIIEHCKKGYRQFSTNLIAKVLDKDKAEDAYYAACNYGILERWIPIVIDEEFDNVVGEEGLINYIDFLQIVGNIIAKYGLLPS